MKKLSSHIKDMLYVLLLPLLFIAILSRFFNSTSSHYSRLDILAHKKNKPIYPQSNFIVTVIC